MKLTVVGLPIGNVSDISERAINKLSEAKFIVCEDTRMFSNLWSKLKSLGKVQDLQAKLVFVNDFNEFKVLPRLITDMNSMEEAVLVSDAGMPLISDPGYKLVRQGLDLGWEVEVIPGPTAESAALAVSGLPTDKYMFLGFLPKKPGKRGEILRQIGAMWKLMNFSVVIYESAQRVEKVLEELASIWGPNLPISVSIDLTKNSDKTIRGGVSEVKEIMKSLPVKGEVTIVVGSEKENYL